MMSSSTNDEFTIATLPPDVIRTIIALDAGTTTDNLRLLGRSWNPLVTVYRNALPNIAWMDLKLKDGFIEVLVDTPWRHLYAATKYEKLRAKFRKCDTKRFVYNNKNNNGALNFITNFIRRTNQIKHLSLISISDSILNDIGKTLHNLKIDCIRSNDSTFSLRQAAKIIRQHSVVEIDFNFGFEIGIELTNFIAEISDTVYVLDLDTFCNYDPKLHEMTALFGCEADTFEKAVFHETSKISMIRIVCCCREFFHRYFLSSHLKFMWMFEYFHKE